jgi:hypothetical protein
MNAEILQKPQLSIGRLVLLGLSSVVLCVSFVMSVFAPFPIALAVILYGRAKGYLTGLLGLVLTYVFAMFVYSDQTLFGFYFCVLVFGLAIAEIVIRGISPIKGIVVFGLVFMSLVLGSFGLVLRSQNTTPQLFAQKLIEKSWDKITEQKKLIEQSSDENSIDALQLLSQPEVMARDLVQAFPSYFFMGMFLMLWFNLFLVLKSRRLLLAGQDYPYSERNLLSFKVPFGFVILLALGLVLAVWGEDLGIKFSELIGFTIIKCLGIFYFFQGFGVFSDLLNFLGVMGFFRTVIVMLVVFTANYLIAAAGLFDNWFDFRKYFVRPKNED